MTTSDKLTAIVNSSPQLDQLLQFKGIASSYTDFAGDTVEISHEDKVGILAFMGIRMESPEDIERELKRHQDELYAGWLPIAPVVTAHREQTLILHLTTKDLSRQFSWSVVTELGTRLHGHFRGCELIETAKPQISDPNLSERQFSLPPLPAGYHQLQLDNGDRSCQVNLIAAPTRCYEPRWVGEPVKLAGVSLQLYSLKSDRNWGIGDFTDLQTFISFANEAQLDFIVLNPLHILDELAPELCSPYSPMDRRFLNPLYIDLEREPDFRESSSIQNNVEQATFQQRLEELRCGELVDYIAVNQSKGSVLSKMFEQFQKIHLQNLSSRGQAFTDWLTGKGQALSEFSEFQATRSRFAQHMSHIPKYHSYLQWLAESQFEACQQLALQKGMTIGLVRDLAVGSKVNSAEVLLNPDLFCVEASIGAPPDLFAPQGQNWGLPPMNPNALQISDYRHFIAILKHNMTHCGALRIDHVMSLMRLWWCPRTEHTGAGAYVYYPAEELFAILRLESQRHQCVIIGEDLGLVPLQIRQLMAQSGIFSNVLFYFEKYDGVYFKKPEHYPPQALAMVTNHDVPLLTAWWNTSDLELRNQNGLFDKSEDLAIAISARESELIQVLHWLSDQGLLPESWRDFNIHRSFDQDLCMAILEACGRSASRLVSIQLEDISLVEKPINIPGTSDEYPNWRRKLPVTVVELFNNISQKTLLAAFTRARKQA